MLIVEKYTECCPVLLTSGIVVRDAERFTVQTAAGHCQGKARPLAVKGCAIFHLVVTGLVVDGQFCSNVSLHNRLINENEHVRNKHKGEFCYACG